MHVHEGKTIVLVSLACDTSNNGRLCTSYERDQVGVRGRGGAVGGGGGGEGAGGDDWIA